MDCRKILVLGKNGQLAQALSKVLPLENTVFWSSDDLDLRKTETVQNRIITHSPTILICAAAFTQVDLAEKEVEEAQLVNTAAVAEMAKACALLMIPLIHFSTDYVFDGNAKEPYSEKSATGPLNVYGATKLAGEIEIQKYHRQSLIFRVTWLFSTHGKNFLNTMLKLGQERNVLRVVNDQVGAPTYVDDIAKALLTVLNSSTPEWGVYNLTNSGSCTWYDFACAIFQEAKIQGIELKVTEVVPITSAEFPTPAVRPKNSVLNNEKVYKTFGVKLRGWREAMADCISEKLK